MDPNYTVYLNFSEPGYQQYEDEGPICITLKLDKSALSDMTIEVIEKNITASGELHIIMDIHMCTYTYSSVQM